MKALLAFSRGVDRLTERLGDIAVALVLLTVVIGFGNVALRYTGRLFGVRLTSNALIETQWYLYSLVFFLGFAYILKHGINVRVDFLFAKWNRKKQALWDFIGHTIFLVPFCVLGIWVTIHPVLASWGRLPSGEWGMWEVSPDPNGLPRAPIKSMILFAFLFLLLQALSELIKLLAVLRDAPAQVEIASTGSRPE